MFAVFCTGPGRHNRAETGGEGEREAQGLFFGYIYTHVSRLFISVFIFYFRVRFSFELKGCLNEFDGSVCFKGRERERERETF